MTAPVIALPGRPPPGRAAAQAALGHHRCARADQAQPGPDRPGTRDADGRHRPAGDLCAAVRLRVRQRHRASGRRELPEYLIGGMLGMGLAGTAPGTAVALVTDMSTGLIDRFARCRCPAPRCWPGALADLLTQGIGRDGGPGWGWPSAGGCTPGRPTCWPRWAWPCCSATRSPGPAPAWAWLLRSPEAAQQTRLHPFPAADVHLQRVRADPGDARLAAGGRELEPAVSALAAAAGTCSATRTRRPPCRSGRCSTRSWPCCSGRPALHRWCSPRWPCGCTGASRSAEQAGPGCTTARAGPAQLMAAERLFQPPRARPAVTLASTSSGRSRGPSSHAFTGPRSAGSRTVTPSQPKPRPIAAMSAAGNRRCPAGARPGRSGAPRRRRPRRHTPRSAWAA